MQCSQNCLTRIREGNQTEEDLSVLKTRNISLRDSKYPDLKNELHLFPCNAAVDTHNANMFDNIDTEKAKIESFDVVLGEDSEEVKQKILGQIKGKRTNDTGNLSEILKVAVGLQLITYQWQTAYATVHHAFSEKFTIWKNKSQFQVVCGSNFQTQPLVEIREESIGIITKNIQKYQKNGLLYGLSGERSCFEGKR